MIKIKRSATADTRSCDWSKVSEVELFNASMQHISDVKQALDFFAGDLGHAAVKHDYDKLTDISTFHHDFKTGFDETTWWDRHRKINRHHLTMDDGVRDDVNLIDVLEFVADCVTAGMARTGEVFPMELSAEVLQKALANTVSQLKGQIEVEG